MDTTSLTERLLRFIEPTTLEEFKRSVDVFLGTVPIGHPETPWSALIVRISGWVGKCHSHEPDSNAREVGLTAAKGPFKR